jgi:EAL domain-containing protein (putative c-di-GMP-specific phosphodiesterase class I)
VRCEHPGEGIIGPNVFIPLAEESGLINKLSDWVLEESVRQLKTWISKGYKLTLAPEPFRQRFNSRGAS